MTTDAGRAVAKLPPAEITVARIVALDWYDAPLEGFIEFSRPRSSWFFSAYAETSSQDEPNDLLFVLAPLPGTAMDDVIDALSCLEGQKEPVWVPDWKFSNAEEQRATERRINEIVASAGEPEIVVRSQMLRSIESVWQVITRSRPGTPAPR